MKSKIIRHSMVAVSLAVFVVACNKSPTSPDGGGGGTTISSLAITGDITLSEGQTSQLTATATMSDGTTQVVTTQAMWSSANTSIATVSPTGLVTARVAGTAQITAVFSGRTGARSVQVSAANYSIRVRAESVTAIGTCDDITQGSGTGEFAIRVRALPSVGSALSVSETRDYPGSTSGPFVHALSRNASLSLSGSRTFTLSGQPGRSVRVEFRATEWDTRIVIIPPRVDNVRDSSMNDRSTSRTHAFLNGAFDGIGSRTLTIGNSTCGIRLNYSVTATRQ